MTDDSILERFRSALRADLARGGAKPLRTYLRQFGVRHADAITREYAALVAPSPGLSLGNDRPPVPSAPTATEVTSGDVPPSAAGGLPRLGAPLSEKEEIARGGMGAIVRVRDESLQRDLAMKVVLPGAGGPSQEALLRFIDEARVQARLDHPGVVPIHHLGADATGRVCFTMKLVAGRSLAEILAASRSGEERANLVKTVQTLLRVCETVEFAHAKGVVHRDLKPANVMVGAFGEVYVMDWGLAKTAGRVEAARTGASPESASASCSGLTQVGAVIGTPTYMPPEQAQGRNDQVDARSDVYSIGAVLYEALAGRAPYHVPGTTRSAIETLRDVIAGPPPALAKLAPRGFEELVAVADKAMARDPAGRYPSARGLGEDLQRWIEGRVVRAHRTGAWAELRKWVRRNKAVAAVLALLFVVVAVATSSYVVLARDASRRIGKERDDALDARNEAVFAKNEAVASKNEAVTARDEARASARRADGLRLATLSATKADDDATLASLLAYEAALRAPGAETTSALFGALRGFGEVHTLVGNLESVQHGLYSPDGRRIYTAGRSGRVIAWDVGTGRELRRAAVGSEDIVTLSLADGGKKLLAVSLTAPSRLMDADTLATIREYPSIDGKLVFDGSLSPDEKRLVLAEEQRVRVLDVATGVEICRFEGHSLLTTSARWSPDGTRVASTGADYHVRVWDAADARPIADVALGAPKQTPTFEPANPAGVAGQCPFVEWSADGARVIAWGPRVPDRNRAAVWDAATGKKLFTGDPSTPWIEVMGMTPDRRRAIVDEQLPKNARRQVLVDLATGAAEPTPWNEARGECRRPAFSADGRLVAMVSAAGDRAAVTVWTTDAGAKVRSYVAHGANISECAFSPDATRLLTCSADERASIWEISSDAYRIGVPMRASPGVTPELWSVDTSGDLVAVAWKKTGDVQIGAEVADSATGRVVLAVPDGAGVRELSLSPDGGRVVVLRGQGMADGSLEALEVPSGKCLARLEGRAFQDVRFDKSGRLLVFRAKTLSGRDYDDSAFVVEIGSDVPPKRFDNPDPGHAQWKLVTFAFSPDASRLAAVQQYSGACVWDVASGAVVGRTRGHMGMVMNVAFSPDGRRVATSSVDTSVQINDVESGKRLVRYAGLPRKRAGIAFSPDGSVVAAASFELVCLFDAATGREIGRIPKQDMQFVPRVSIDDAGRVVLALRDGTVRTMPLDPVAWFKDRRPRELTAMETSTNGVGDAADQTERELRRVLDAARTLDIEGETATMLKLGRVEDAERCARRVMELDPDDCYAHVAAARMAERRGDLDEAFACLRRARAHGMKQGFDQLEASFVKCRLDPRWGELGAK